MRLYHWLTVMSPAFLPENKPHTSIMESDQHGNDPGSVGFGSLRIEKEPVIPKIIFCSYQPDMILKISVLNVDYEIEFFGNNR